MNDLNKKTYSSTEIGGEAFALHPLNVLEARTLQLKIGKILGAPFIKFLGDGSGTEEEIFVDGLSSALHSIEPEKSVALIQELCELTMNQTKQSPTSYIRDFTGTDTKDLELSFWVVEQVFGNFLGALGQSSLGAQVASFTTNPDSQE